MSYNTSLLYKWWLGIAALLALGLQCASADNPPVVSGSYEVVQNRELGSRTQIQMHIRLINHGPSDLAIQRITLWDFSHPSKGGSHACAVALRAHSATETTQEFIIPHSDYQLWQKGLRPRFVLQIAGPRNIKSKAVVRLDRSSGEEAK
jgi:hypothetical protein